MKIIATLQKEHAQLLTESTTFMQYIEHLNTPDDALKAISQFNHLYKLLAQHLHTENDFLFPVLKTHHTPLVRETALALEHDIAPLSKRLKLYHKEWHTYATILATRSHYITETKTLIQLLKDRIDAEEKDLFAYLRTQE